MAVASAEFKTATLYQAFLRPLSTECRDDPRRSCSDLRLSDSKLKSRCCLRVFKVLVRFRAIFWIIWTTSDQPMIRWVILIAMLIPPAAGCRQPAAGTTAPAPLFDFSQYSMFGQAPSTQTASNSYYGGSQPAAIQANSPEAYREYSQLTQQMESLNQKLSAFNSDNEQLYAEIAGLKQKLQVANDYNSQIRQQLADNSVQFQQLQVEKQNLQRQLASTVAQTEQFASTTGAAPTQLIGAATVRANNSLLQKLNSIQIPGGQARMDGDVIRIEFPSDNLFAPGTYEIRPEQTTTVRNIATTIQQNFPSQIVGIEAHWDGTPLNPPTTSHHQLTATQSLAVFNRLIQFGLPDDQLFTMAMGSNRPRQPQSAAGGNNANRRIEIVIYPETFNGS